MNPDIFNIFGMESGALNDEWLEFGLTMSMLMPPQLKKQEKNNKLAEYYRKEGDRYLEKCMFQDAIDAYTNALLMAVPKSETMAICFKLRATVLQRIKAYDDSLLDIERALELTLKEDMKKTLLQMKTKVIEAQKTAPKIKKDKQNKHVHTNVIVAHGESHEIPGTSNAIKLSYNRQFGRHFVATMPIAAGEVLMSQEPYITFLVDTKKLRFCHECMKRTMALIPCDTCTYALYCSPTCRTKAYESYHKTECKFANYELEILQPIRLFLIVTNQGDSLKELLDYVKKKPSNKRTVGFINDQFIGNSAQAFLSLTNHKTARFYLELIGPVSVAVALLKRYTDILNRYDLLEVGKFMFHLLCTFRMNVVGIRDKGFNDTTALCLYPVFNLLNHSCVTNTIWYTANNNQRVLVACRDIEPGEQIFNNYFGLAIFLSSENRKQILSEFKFFECSCEACSRNYTLERKLRRVKVPVHVQRQLRKNPIDIDSMWQVLKCMYQEIKVPCVEVESMKFALMEAYLNKENDELMKMYRALNII